MVGVALHFMCAIFFHWTGKTLHENALKRKSFEMSKLMRYFVVFFFVALFEFSVFFYSHRRRHLYIFLKFRSLRLFGSLKNISTQKRVTNKRHNK